MPIQGNTVIITFQDNSFYSVLFRDLEFKIPGIYRDEESYAYLSTGKHLPAEFGLTPPLRR